MMVDYEEKDFDHQAKRPRLQSDGCSIPNSVLNNQVTEVVNSTTGLPLSLACGETDSPADSGHTSPAQSLLSNEGSPQTLQGPLTPPQESIHSIKGILPMAGSHDDSPVYGSSHHTNSTTSTNSPVANWPQQHNPCNSQQHSTESVVTNVKLDHIQSSSPTESLEVEHSSYINEALSVYTGDMNSNKGVSSLQDYQTGYPNTASYYGGTIQAYAQPGTQSSSYPYSSNTATGFYNNHHHHQGSSQANAAAAAYGLLSQSFAVSGSRGLGQSAKSSSSSTLSQPSYLNPYGSSGVSFGASTNGNQMAQSPYSYATSPYPTTGLSGASSAASQGFASSQQAIDYGSYGGYSQGSYPYYSTPQTYGSYLGNGNGTLGLHATTGVGSSATYQLASLSTGSTAESPQHGYSLDSSPSPPLVKNEIINNPNNRKAGSKNSSRGRGRRHQATNNGNCTSDTSPDPEHSLERVFIWDLDETIILFHSLLSGSFSQRYGKDSRSESILSMKMEELIFTVADNHFFFNDLEECDQVHIDDVSSDDNGQDLSSYNFQADGFHSAATTASLCLATGVKGGVDWMRKLAFRYRRIKEIFGQFKNNSGGLLCQSKREELSKVRADIETLTENWLSLAMKCLSIIHSRSNCINVLVTTNQLVPALVKVLLFGLGGVFVIENVYSSTKIGKESCFQRVVNRFGRKCTYVVVGDGKDEESAAKQFNFPFWRVSSHSDLAALHHALDLGHL